MNNNYFYLYTETKKLLVNAYGRKSLEIIYIPALQHSPKDARIPGYGIRIAVQSEVVALAGPYRSRARTDQHARHVQQPRAREQESHDEKPAMIHLVNDISGTFAFHDIGGMYQD